jgi:hypothetical protein
LAKKAKFPARAGKTKLYPKSIGKIKNIVYLTKEEFSDEPLAVPTSVFLSCLRIDSCREQLDSTRHVKF